LGVGCACPDQEMVEFGSDVLIVCFDGASYWSARARLAEMGVGVITVEHGTSEMWGMESLRDHLAEVFPEIDFVYLAEHPRTWTVRA
jgi:putative NIF3 family GTP cyclohydrolase 1 type 2